MPPKSVSNNVRNAHAVRQTMVQLTITGERVVQPPEPVEVLEREEQLTDLAAGTSSNAGASSSISPMPSMASIERERSTKRKAPEGPRGHSKGGRLTKETKVAPFKRIAEFEDQGLTMSAGKLFCQACHEVQPNLKESIRRHLLTGKHINNLVKFKERAEANEKAQDSLAQYFNENVEEKGVRSLLANCVLIPSLL